MKFIRELVTKGMPLDGIPFVDVHCHFGTWTETTVPESTDHHRFIAEMDRYGCDMAWMCASGPGWADEVGKQNDAVLDFSAAFPDRILPYCTLSSLSTDKAAEELNRCMGLGRCIGVKMHRYNQPTYTMKSTFLQPVLEILNEKHLVYLNHQFVNHDDLLWALGEYPSVTFISGHGVDRAINDLALRLPNIRDCTCAALAPDEVAREVTRLQRSDTMLVGSDFGLFHLGFGLGMIAYAEITEEAKRRILGGNAIEILERTSV